MKAYHALPSFHLKRTFVPGVTAGLLASSGTLCALIAVSALGQGIGGSFIQSSMLVSGLWGIALGEIKGARRITRWIVSSITTIAGVVCLSQ